MGKLTEIAENFYNTIKNLPNKHPEELNLISSGFEEILGEYSKLMYTSFITTHKYSKGIKGRLCLWKDYILPEWYNLSLEKNAEEEKLEVKISNHLFKSRLSINGSNDVKLDVWSPKFSTILSSIFGNRIRAELRKK